MCKLQPLQQIKKITQLLEILYEPGSRGLPLVAILIHPPHPGSKSKILDIRILNPQKMKKVYPPVAFFLFTSIRGIFALYESLGQNINDPI